MLVEFNSIYSYFIEPSLTIGYCWLLWILSRSRSKELDSSFFAFFALSGIAACLNIIMVHLTDFKDTVVSWLAIRDVYFNVVVFGSHSFSLTHTIGKALVVAFRFTSICYPLEQIWTRFRTKIAAVFMFIVPAALFSFMLFLEETYRFDSSGKLIYFGVALWAEKLSKLISFIGYIFFIILSIPMCAVSIYHLRKAQNFNAHHLKQERLLLIYTIIITFVHLVKSGQQIFWFFTLEMNDTQLIDLARRLYNIANALTTFVPPLLLLFTSTRVRYEVTLGCLGRGGRNNATILPLVSSTNVTTNIPNSFNTLPAAENSNPSPSSSH